MNSKYWAQRKLISPLSRHIFLWLCIRFQHNSPYSTTSRLSVRITDANNEYSRMFFSNVIGYEFRMVLKTRYMLEL